MKAVRELLHPRGEPPADPDEAAAYWSARRRLGLSTAKDEAAFEAWLADPAHAAAFEAADGPMEALGALAAAPEIQRMRQAALKAAPPHRTSRAGWRVAAGMAAAIIGVIALAAVLLDRPSLPGPLGPVDGPATTAPADAPSPRYATAVGERLEVTLDDGSVMTLNTASVVEVDYSAASRGIRLLRGQALFQVAHQADRPFVVAAGDRRIIARGTAFDVRLDGDDVQVVLIEGRVDVQPTVRSGLARILPALSQQTLSPGEQLEARHEGPMRVKAADVARTTSWRRGQAVFHEDRLETAVAEMNRYSAAPIVIGDPRIAALPISGVFGVARPENFVAAVTTFHPVDAVKRADGATVLSGRETG